VTRRTSTKGAPMQPVLTADRLRSVLDYDRETGCFSWRVTGRGIARLGAKAGAFSDAGGGRKYIKIRIDGRLYFAHRLAWFWVHGSWPEREIDHADSDGTNNRIGNLRLASSSQNKWNARVRRDNTSGFKGAVKDWGGGWAAQIAVCGVYRRISGFGSAAEAAAAYDELARVAFGDFARTNEALGLL
jgi:hypothetical protein